MKFESITSIAAALALALPAQATVTVSNVAFTQDEATHDVTVTYELTTGDREPAFVTLDVLTNGVPLPVAAVQTVSGDVSASLADFVADGAGKTIIWKARTDWKGNLTSNAEVIVSAHYTNHIEGVYLRVDVTGGKDADSWPHHFGVVEPDVSSEAFLHDELWFKCVPAGTFLMGSPESELGRSNDETQHLVTLTKPFFIGVTPVTRKQWQYATGGTNSLAIVGKEGCPAGNVRYTYTSANTTRADTFISKLASKTGLAGFALPTEAQWEYACRADTQGVWGDGSPWDPGTTGNSPSISTNLAVVGWYADNSPISGTTKVVHQVATRAPNAWGLYDFNGNVWELCRDSKRTYTRDPVEDPKGTIPDSSGSCVKRGGSKDTAAFGCRTARRNTNGTTGTQETNGARFVLEF